MWSVKCKMWSISVKCGVSDIFSIQVSKGLLVFRISPKKKLIFFLDIETPVDVLLIQLYMHDKAT